MSSRLTKYVVEAAHEKAITDVLSKAVEHELTYDEFMRAQASGIKFVEASASDIEGLSLQPLYLLGRAKKPYVCTSSEPKQVLAATVEKLPVTPDEIVAAELSTKQRNNLESEWGKIAGETVKVDLDSSRVVCNCASELGALRLFHKFAPKGKVAFNEVLSTWLFEV